MSGWKSWNDGQVVEDPSQPFTLECPPGTDLWEKPPAVHSSNAPGLLTTLAKGSFLSARVTVSAKWTQKYDQGGLALMIHDGSSEIKWIKTGIEFLNEQPQVSTVATYKWSDWSLTPMPSQNSASTTVEMESNEDGSLWVYLIDGHGNRSPIREVTWWGEVNENQLVAVGVYVAKPDKDPKKLLVSFQGLEVKTRK